MTLQQDLDNHNYMHVNNPRAKAAVIKNMEELNLCDIWRDLNPDTKTFSWVKRDPLKMARLDYFLISGHLSPYVIKSHIAPGFKSDHSLVSLEECGGVCLEECGGVCVRPVLVRSLKLSTPSTSCKNGWVTIHYCSTFRVRFPHSFTNWLPHIQ